ncbi:hypothetical protein LH23_11030 [Cedecea neteri]|uniref:DUF1574 domain-containing protein n=1 Tax=Cedecea neteri TaxID=158822 RepID=A0AAN0S4R5_9ENTR|nr:hypothetical protein [Cedecea neteri]AIR61175.1 hypothetical protein LH23_11030 [Cedecea neteri]
MEFINKINSDNHHDIEHFIFQNPAVIRSDKNTATLIKRINSKLSTNEAADIASTDFSQLKSILFNFPLIIVFIGTKDNYDDFKKNREFPDTIDLFHVKPEQLVVLTALLDDLATSEVIFIYDRYSLSVIADIADAFPSSLFNTLTEVNNLLDVQIAQMTTRSLHHSALNRSLAHYLTSPDISKIAIGSSYPWAAFPEKLLTNTANLSMHCADLTFSASVIKGLHPIKNIDEIVLLLSPYDLYYELSQSRNNEILTTFNALKNFCAEHHFEYETNNSAAYDFIFHYGEQLKNNFPLFFLDTLLYTDAARMDVLSKLQTINSDIKNKNDHSFAHQQNYMANDDERKYSRASLDPHAQENSCTERARKHARHYRYKASFTKNKENIKALISFTENHGIKLNVIMSPFPARYLDNIEHNMIVESRDFFTSLHNNGFRYIDLLEDSDFSAADFYDGDHLNFSGAEKLYSKLKQLDLFL